MSGKTPPGLLDSRRGAFGQVARPNNAAPHNVVITTNFRTSGGDACRSIRTLFANRGHESLAGFAGVSLTRPLICKIHRDLLFARRMTPQLETIERCWGIALTKLFEHYTPVFIGYGGNDDP